MKYLGLSRKISDFVFGNGLTVQIIPGSATFLLGEKCLNSTLFTYGQKREEYPTPRNSICTPPLPPKAPKFLPAVTQGRRTVESIKNASQRKQCYIETEPTILKVVSGLHAPRCDPPTTLKDFFFQFLKKKFYLNFFSLSSSILCAYRGPPTTVKEQFQPLKKMQDSENMPFTRAEFHLNSELLFFIFFEIYTYIFSRDMGILNSG